jgi:hypothetical protein
LRVLLVDLAVNGHDDAVPQKEPHSALGIMPVILHRDALESVGQLDDIFVFGDHGKRQRLVVESTVLFSQREFECGGSLVQYVDPLGDVSCGCGLSQRSCFRRYFIPVHEGSRVGHRVLSFVAGTAIALGGAYSPGGQ